jgi:dGTPase
MRDYGGFEHNLQSLRVVDLLEERYAEFPGLNLTYEAREGILKHCSVKNAAELGEVGRRFIERKQPSLEAQLANLADEIAYNNHDVDDGLRSGLLSIEALREIALFARQNEEVERRYPQLAPRRKIHETIRRMINHVVTDLIETSRRRITESGVAGIDEVRNYPAPLIDYSPAVREETQSLKRFLRQHLYAHYRVRRMSTKAVRTVRELFGAFLNDPRLLPDQDQERIRHAGPGDEPATRARIIADYVAGMTDRYAIREHARLFSPDQLT